MVTIKVGDKVKFTQKGKEYSGSVTAIVEPDSIYSVETKGSIVTSMLMSPVVTHEIFGEVNDSQIIVVNNSRYLCKIPEIVVKNIYQVGSCTFNTKQEAKDFIKKNNILWPFLETIFESGDSMHSLVEKFHEHSAEIQLFMEEHYGRK